MCASAFSLQRLVCQVFVWEWKAGIVTVSSLFLPTHPNIFGLYRENIGREGKKESYENATAPPPPSPPLPSNAGLALLVILEGRGSVSGVIEAILVAWK